jgi:2-amino-4-hydroxy-6-hydroxymethyldihydropteridine diphosphokinase
MSGAVAAYVGLGANLGDAAATLHAAFAELGALPQTQLVRASRLYRTPAWGIAEQPDFVNAVAALETGLDARGLLDRLLGIEMRHGRDRSAGPHWGPRTLDLDLLLYGQAQIDEPGLRVPHPLMHRRAFVLAPLLEIAPDVEIPGFGPARNAASSLDAAELSNIAALSGDNGRP